ncbi:hypothetical protein P1X14_12125 [Sphingomonas sp. AOB5]|uniref:hypothetical protein n=1 Tax=Sphingomonas sp. AOB5 TaxID=3034017 RepID=UPI0023F8158A|nr:hypothetical protein [Sphingomonas sp. AOB5]MDF7775996.1 hypothetical protein [Sphingomonas sp. AOB5]
MIRLLCAAAALCAAIPAAAQSTDGDWWWVDTGAGQSEEILLVDGEPRRSGDLSELATYIAYREPDPDKVIGVDATVTIDCVRNTVAIQLKRLNYSDGRFDEMTDRGDTKPLPTTTASYQFACTADRAHSRYYGKRPRLGLAAEIFAANPKR